MKINKIKVGWYLIVLLFAIFVFIVDEKIAIMVVVGIGVIVMVLGGMKYILTRFNESKSNEK